MPRIGLLTCSNATQDLGCSSASCLADLRKRRGMFAAIMLLLSISAILIYAHIGYSFTAGFDCTKAKSKIEKTICESKELADADAKLNILYKSILPVLHPGGVVQFKNEQLGWLHNRDISCGMSKNMFDCIKYAYEQRFGVLLKRKEAAERHHLAGNQGIGKDPSLIPLQFKPLEPWLKRERYRIVADFDSDGMKDVSVSEDTSEFAIGGNFTLYLGTAAGTFREVGSFYADPPEISLQQKKSEGLLTTLIKQNNGDVIITKRRITPEGIFYLEEQLILRSDAAGTGDRASRNNLIEPEYRMKVEYSETKDDVVTWKPMVDAALFNTLAWELFLDSTIQYYYAPATMKAVNEDKFRVWTREEWGPSKVGAKTGGFDRLIEIDCQKKKYLHIEAYEVDDGIRRFPSNLAGTYGGNKGDIDTDALVYPLARIGCIGKKVKLCLTANEQSGNWRGLIIDLSAAKRKIQSKMYMAALEVVAPCLGAKSEKNVKNLEDCLYLGDDIAGIAVSELSTRYSKASKDLVNTSAHDEDYVVKQQMITERMLGPYWEMGISPEYSEVERRYVYRHEFYKMLIEIFPQSKYREEVEDALARVEGSAGFHGE